MASGQASISLPVSLTILNLLQIINQLLSKLSNLKVGSKGFREIQSIMGSISREIDRLLILTSKPFISLSQFNLTERTVSKIEDELERVQITMSRIKFSDLELTPDLAGKMKEFESQLQSIQTSIKKVKETAKQEFLTTDSGKAWLGMDPTAVNQSLSLITNAINSEVRKLKKALEDAESAVKSYETLLALQQKMGDFSSSIKSASSLKDTKAAFGEMYSKMFTTSGTAFKTGGRKVMEEWLISQFDISPDKVREIVSLKASDVFKSLLSGELNTFINDKLKSLNTQVTKAKASNPYETMDAAKVSLDGLLPILESIRAANEGVTTSEEGLQGKLRELNHVVEEYLLKITAAARGNQEIGKTCTSANLLLANFRTELSKANVNFLLMERTVRNFNSIKMAITNFMGFTLILNLTKRAIREALNHIKELDSVMNRISIVTNMTTGDLWKLVDAYSDMALKYGVSIKGAYEVSQIYYQQGLLTADVLTLTNETLKLAKVSGLDYALTTDYMTTALRGFKMEMSDASIVVDVYSNLAAHTAVTLEELAVAMSKTASSLESVGSTFLESSAMISTMVAVTRESATNIGSALKSIAARYGEMKKDPATLIDSEGEALAFNKVDTALQSVGISMRDTNGLFRNFTDVIIELSEKWNTLESTQLRYIATQFAGNRQQSRFLALVSNGDLLKSNLQYAENSEDVGTIQALKALDSIESKTEQVRVAYLLLYTTVGVEDMWKGFLDGAKNVMDTMTHLPKVFNKVPLGAIALVADFVNVIKTMGLLLLGGISKIWDKLLPNEMPDKMKNIAELSAQAFVDAIRKIIGEVDIGGQMSDKVREQAEKAGLDKNRASGDTKKVEKAVEPAKTNVESLVAASERAALAATTLARAEQQTAALRKQAADDAEREAEATRQIADAQASTTRSISTGEELRAALVGTNINETILAQLAGHEIDVNTPILQVLNMFAQILRIVDASGGQLREAFSKAGDDAIAGYVTTLLTAAGVENAGEIVGKLSVEALRNAIGAHSPAVETMITGNDYMDGLNEGISQRLNDTIAKGYEAGKSAVEGLERGLQLNANSFEKLKEGLLKEFDSLSDEAFASLEERAATRAKLAGTTFESFLSGLANAAFYKVARMRQERMEQWTDFGYSKNEALREYAKSPKSVAYINGMMSPEDLAALKARSFDTSTGEFRILESMRLHGAHAMSKDSFITDYKIDKIPFPLDSDKPKTAAGARRGLLYNGLTEQYYASRDREIAEESRRLAEEAARIKAERERSGEAFRASIADLPISLQIRLLESERAKEMDSMNRTGIGYDWTKLNNQLGSWSFDISGPKAFIDSLLRKVNEEFDARLKELDSTLRGGKLRKASEELATERTNALEAARRQGIRNYEEHAALKKQYDSELIRIGDKYDPYIKLLKELKKIDEENERSYSLSKTMLAAEDKARVNAQNNPLWDKDLAELQAKLAEALAAEAAKMQKELALMLAADEAKALSSVIPMRLAVLEGAEATITNGVLEVKDKVLQLMDTTPIQVPVESKPNDLTDELIAKLEALLKVKQEREAYLTNSSDGPTNYYNAIEGAKNLGFTDKLLHPKFIDETISKVKTGEEIEAETAAIEKLTDALKSHAEAKKADSEAQLNNQTDVQLLETKTEAIKNETAAVEKHTEAVTADKLASEGSSSGIDFSQYKTVRPEVRDREAFVGTVATGEGVTPTKMASWAELAAAASTPIKAPDVVETEEKGAKAGSEMADALNAEFSSKPALEPDVLGVPEAGTKAANQLTESIESTFKPPKLSSTSLNVFDEHGIQQTVESITTILEKIGTVSDELKAKLLELFNSGNHAEFIKLYNGLTGMNGTAMLGTFVPPTDAVGADVYNNPMGNVLPITGTFTDNSASIALMQSLIDKMVEAKVISEETGASLKAMLEGGSENPALDALTALINKLILVGSISEATGAKLKASLNGASPELLIATMQRLTTAILTTGSAARTAGGALKKMDFSTLGSAIRMLASITGLSLLAKGAITLLGGVITGLGIIIKRVNATSKEAAATNPWIAIAMAIMAVVNGISLLWETDEEKLERLTKLADELNNKAKQANANVRDLETAQTQLKELEKTRYESAESAEKYQSVMDGIADKFPQLISGFDEAGNVIVKTRDMELTLALARDEAAEATLSAVKAEREKTLLELKKKTQELTDTLGGIKLDEEKLKEDRANRAAVIAASDSNKTDLTDFGMGRMAYIATGNDSPFFYEALKAEDTAAIQFLSMAQEVSANKEEYENPVDKFNAEDISWSKFLASDEFLGAYDVNNDSYDLKTLHQNLLDQRKELRAQGKELSVEALTVLKYLDMLYGSTVEIIEKKEEDFSTFDDLPTDLKEYLGDSENQELDSDVKIILHFIDKINEVAKNNDTEAVNKYYGWLKAFTGNLPSGSDILVTYTKELETIDEKVGPIVREYLKLLNLDAADVKKIISAEAGFSSDVRKSLALTGLASEYLSSQYDGTSDLNEFMKSETATNAVKAVNNFWTTLGHRYDELGRTLQERFTKMMNDSEHYSDEDIIKELGLDENNDKEIIKMLRASWKSTSQDIKTVTLNNISAKQGNRLNTALTELYTYASAVEGTWTSIDSAYYSAIANLINNLENTGYGKKAKQLVTVSKDLKELLNDTDEATRDAILDSIKTNGISTREGIDKIMLTAKLTGVAEDSKLYEKLKELYDTTTTNISLSMQTLTEDFTKNWSNSSKSIKKLTSGIEFTDMLGILDEADAFKDITLSNGQKFTLGRSDFIENGDKLVLTAEKASEYWEAMSQYNRNLAEKFTTQLDEANEVLNLSKDAEGKYSLSSQTSLLKLSKTEKGYDALATVMGAELEEYLKKDAEGNVILDDTGRGTIDPAKVQKLRQRVSEKFAEDKEAIQKYSDYIDYADAQVLKIRDWNEGNFKSLNKVYKNFDGFKNLGDTELTAKVTQHLRDLASGVALLTEEERQQPDITNAVELVRSVSSQFVSDLLEKDISTLYAKDYLGMGLSESDIQAKLNEASNAAKDKLASSFAILISNMAKDAGQSLEQQNDTFVKAFDKVNKSNTVDGIKDFKFSGKNSAYASTLALLTFANNYGLKLADIVNTEAAKYNEKLGLWVVDFTKIDTQFPAIDGFLEVVADSVAEFFTELTNLIQDGMKGALSNIKRKQLEDYAFSEFGITDLEFEKVNGGWELTLDSLKRLIDVMKDSDASVANRNELVISYYKKLNLGHTTDSIKDLDFLDDSHFAASDDELLKLASEYNLDLQNLMELNLIYWDKTLGEYVVNWLSIDNLSENFNKMDHFKDAVKDSTDLFFKKFTDLVSKGIDGTLTNMETGLLKDLAKKFGINPDTLTFTDTTDGLKLANNAAKQLYSTIDSIDGKSGNIVFDKLYESLVKSNDEFKSVQTTTAHMKTTLRDLRGAEMIKAGVTKEGGLRGLIAMFDQMNGNVDLYKRKKIERPDLGEGVYSTIETATLDSRNFETDIPWVMNITPIPPDALTFEDILSDEDLNAYVQDLMDGLELDSDTPIETKILAILDADADLANGGKGLIINLVTAKEITDDIVNNEAARAQTLHEISEVYEAIKDGEEFDPTKIDLYKEELELCLKILAIRGTSEDNSFKFMELDIPAGLKNPLNYFENWAKAYEAIKKSTKGGKGEKGFMDYTDFYNLATEMGNLAEITGDAVTLGGKTLENAKAASKLIEEAAGALTVTSDGKMKVDLSKIGVDFKTGADQMNKDVDAGIDEVAQALIDMLDSLIKVLEVVVAMDLLGDVDVNSDNVIDLDEVFKIEYNPETGEQSIVGFLKAFDTWRANLIEEITDGADGKINKDLADAMGSIKINGESLSKLIQLDEASWKNKSISEAKAFTLTLSALYQAAMSDNYDPNDIAKSIYKVLEESGLDDISIDVGNKTFYLSGHSNWVINWDNEEAINAAKEAIQDLFPHLIGNLDLNNNEDVRTLISKLMEERTKDGITAKEVLDIDLILGLASGTTQIKEITDKKGKGTGQFEGTYKNQTILGSKEDVENAIKRAMELENDGFNFKFTDDGKVEGLLNLNSGLITLTQNSLGKDEYIAKAPNGTTFTTSNKDDALGWLARQGYGDLGTYKFGNQTYNVFIDATTGLSYSINAETGEFICDNHHFKSYDQLLEYLAVKELGKGGISTYDSKTKIETIINGPATITYNHKTGEIKYTWTPPGGSPVEFTGANAKLAYEAYIAAWDQSGGQLDSNGNPMYNVEGAIVSVAYNSDTGELTYTAHLANGKTVTAHDEESLMFGIAAETEPTGGEVTADGKKTYSYVVNAGNVSVAVSVDENGTVTTTGDGASSLAEQTEKEVKKNAEAKLKEDTVALEAPVNAEVNSITVNLADGGIVNAANIGTKIIEAINAYLSANPIDAKILFGVTASPKRGTDGDNSDTDVPNPFADILKSLNEITTTSIENVQKAIDALNGNEAIRKINTSLGTVKTTAIDAVAKKLNSLTAKVTTSVSASEAKANLTVHVVKSGPNNAAGNIGAFAKGNTALVSGTSTLMGELGPELVVSNGRYFVVGLNGAEFVNLLKDAIVFNHKLTQRLLALGGIGSRGVPFTNEQNAISYSKGNITGPAHKEADVIEKISDIYWTGTNKSHTKTFENLVTFKVGGGTSSTSTGSNGGGGGAHDMARAKGTVGPAMASASEALAALKQLRNMWQSLRDMTAKDLAALGGGGSGGGGGNGGDNKVFLLYLDRWYNYLLRIATLEKLISFEETKRARIASLYLKDGKKYYDSQKDSLKYLKEESDKYRDLLADLLNYLRDLAEKSKNGPFSSLYHFDENGQIIYLPDAFATFSKILGTDLYGRPNYSAKELYEMILKLGVENLSKYLEYDSSGNKIEYSGGKPKDEAAYEAAVQAFWDKIEADKNEYLSLADSINESMTKIEELDTKRNEMLLAYRDNLKTVEDKVLKAIEDSRQREIDALSDERQALEESTGKYIDGLSKALDKEREMYQLNQGDDELNRLMRLLGILQRSGGSASQIRDLLNLIQEKLKEAYFDELLRLIDAIQEASNLQLERLDQQIDIMTETLEYLKEMGLLWDDVYEIMSMSAAEIATFIGSDSSTWGDSPLAKDENFLQALFEAEQWRAYAEDVHIIAEGVGTEETHAPNPPDNSQGNYDARAGVEPDLNSPATTTSKNGYAKATVKSKAKVTYKDANGQKVTRYFDTKKEATAFANELKKNKKNKDVKVTSGSYYIWGKKTSKAKTAKIGPYMSEKLAKADLSNQKKLSKVKRSAWKVAKSKPSGYSEGGYDYETGLAMLHGTLEKPEAVFNATLTKILRENILSSKPNSLLSLLETYNQAYKDGIGGITNNDSGIIIENATVNMNVSQIANDYDAQRAGEQALAEMLRIARKTGSSNSVRR